MIVASLAPRSNEEAGALLGRARESGADMAEIRADAVRSPDFRKLLAKKPLPVIATVRPAWEGGSFRGSEEDRIALLREALASGADYIDIEWRAYKELPEAAGRTIVSYHDFEKVPGNLRATARKMEEVKPWCVKIACRANSTRDMLELAELSRSARVPRSIVAMGEWGEPLRILAGKIGSWLTYASLEDGSATAPGQLTVAEMVGTYRAGSIDEASAVYAVVGDPVLHSKGPALWNHAFRRLDMNAVYVRIRLDDPSLVKSLASTLGLSGISVTVPHKEAALGFLDEVDPTADRIGAVNSIVVRGGRLAGSNTDWTGALQAIQEGCEKTFGSRSLAGRKCLVLGAGGMARALVFGLASQNAEVIVANRGWDRASDLAGEFGVKAVPLEAVSDIVSPAVIANATSVGMAPRDESIVPGKLLGPSQLCFDAVYTPPETRFLREAREAGAHVVSGARHFVLQAAEQFRLFTGRELPANLLSEWDRLVRS